MGKLVWTPHLQRFQRQFHDAQKWLDENVLRDAAPFVPKRSGALKRSACKSPGGGAVLWTAPYAAAVYYRKNSRGQRQETLKPWFEAAKARCGQDWIRGVKKRAGGG